MKTWDQETFSDMEKGTYGDCLRACVRTLLQLPLDDAPHPVKSEHSYNDDWVEYLEDMGIVFKYHFIRDGKPDDHIPRVCIATGPAKRGVQHAVVFDRVKGTVIHDPHPSRAGLERVTWYWWL